MVYCRAIVGLVWLLTGTVILATAQAGGAERAAQLYSVLLGDRKIEGKPLAWTDSEVHLLARDGRLWSFAPRDAKQARSLGTAFRPYSAAEQRGELGRELGRGFEVSGTGHFLVAHPAGQRDYWSERFEELYRSFVRYFSVRGFECREPEFPLVAVVFARREDFVLHAQRQGHNVPSGVLGYYSPLSNQVAMYDMGGGTATAKNWQEHSATIVHEATHQLAYNTGVHRRFAVTPRWVVEGLGTMFEAPGVWNRGDFPDASQRLVQGRLKDFRTGVKLGRPKGMLFEIVSNDRIFNVDPGRAYAEAWALSFYLSEARPREYADYLERLARRDVFEDYTSAQRAADFQAAFRGDPRVLERQFLEFMAGLPQ